MNQPWHDIGFMLMGFLIGLPCGFIALVVKLGIEREKKSCPRLDPPKQRNHFVNIILRDDFLDVKEGEDRVND